MIRHLFFRSPRTSKSARFAGSRSMRLLGVGCKPTLEILEDRRLLATITDLGSLGGTGQMGQFSTLPSGINNHGQVVGYSVTAVGYDHAFLWQNGMMTDLGSQANTNSWAYGINNQGEVVGLTAVYNGGNFYDGFLWEPDMPNGTSGHMTLLSEDSSANKINDAGQVVGWGVGRDYVHSDALCGTAGASPICIRTTGMRTQLAWLSTITAR